MCWSVNGFVPFFGGRNTLLMRRFDLSNSTTLLNVHINIKMQLLKCSYTNVQSLSSSLPLHGLSVSFAAAVLLHTAQQTKCSSVTDVEKISNNLSDSLYIVFAGRHTANSNRWLIQSQLRWLEGWRGRCEQYQHKEKALHRCTPLGWLPTPDFR